MDLERTTLDQLHDAMTGATSWTEVGQRLLLQGPAVAADTQATITKRCMLVQETIE
jgi:hypothetical protein